MKYKVTCSDPNIKITPDVMDLPKYEQALTVDFSWYCKCGKALIMTDAHCGFWGYWHIKLFKGEDIVCCPDCEQDWFVEVRAIPIDLRDKK